MARRLCAPLVLLLAVAGSADAAPDAEADFFDDEAPAPVEAVEASDPHSPSAAAAKAKEAARQAEARKLADALKTPLKPQAEAVPNDDRSPQPTAKPRPTAARFGVLEQAGLVFILVFGLNFLYGRQVNERIASKWGELWRELLEEQFASVGESGGIMTKDSPDTFTIDATGRERCEWLQARLKLSPRQDLYKVLAGLLTPKPDKLVLDLCLPEEAEAFVLAVLERALGLTHVNELRDLKTLTAQCPAAEVALPASLRALCEQREIAQLLLAGEAAQLLTLHADAVEQIHYTDYVPAEWGLPAETKRALHLVFALPGGGGAAAMAEASRPLLRLALLLADRIGRMRLAPALKDKVRKGRASLEALKFKEGYKQREEAAQQRKAEKRSAQKQKEPLANREAQRKREEKEARQAAKKKGPQTKMKRI